MLVWAALEGAALSDSISAYVSASNLLTLAGVVVVAVVAPRTIARVVSERTRWAFCALGLLGALGGALLARRIETLALHRNALLTMALTKGARLSRAPEPRPAAALPSLPS